MDFEINGKGKGEFITYKCADIEELFDKALSKFKKLPIHSVVSSFCPCGKVTNTKDCNCPDTNFTDDDLH